MYPPFSSAVSRSITGCCVSNRGETKETAVSRRGVGIYIKKEAPLIIDRFILHRRNKPPFLLQKKPLQKTCNGFLAE